MIRLGARSPPSFARFASSGYDGPLIRAKSYTDQDPLSYLIHSKSPVSVMPIRDFGDITPWMMPAGFDEIKSAQMAGYHDDACLRRFFDCADTPLGVMLFKGLGLVFNPALTAIMKRR